MMEAQGVTGNDDYEVLEQAIVESLTTSIPEVSSKDTIIVNGRLITSLNVVP